MKAHHSLSIYIDNQPIDVNNLNKHSLKSPWQLSIINFVRDFMNDKDSMRVQTSGSTGKPKEIELLKPGCETAQK